MKFNRQINNQIKSALNYQAGHIEPNKNLFNQIKLNIYEKENQETMNHKKFSFKSRKKLIATAVLCLALTSITIIGASLGKSWVSSTNIQYMELPSKATIQQDVGFVPKYTEELPGGFEYKNGGFGTSELLDETQNVLTETKQVSLSYERDKDNQQLMLGANQIEEQYVSYEGCKIVETYKNLPLYYSEHTYKFVPPSYEMTEEDKQAMEAGTMAISVGSREVSIQHYQYISWYEDGIQYSISGFDGNFTIEEMVEMARYIIDQN